MHMKNNGMAINMHDPKEILIPYPQKISKIGGEVKIAEILNPCFSLILSGEGTIFTEAVNIFLDRISSLCACSSTKNAGNYRIHFEIIENYQLLKGKKEGYSLEISRCDTRLIASDEAGILYGVYTLLQLIYQKGNDILLPILQILDYPRFKDRGQFLECRYGSDFMTKEDYKKVIDYFASLKQNSLTIGIYGCWSQQYDMAKSEYLYFPIKKYPELKTPRNIKYYSQKENKWIVKENVYPVMFEEDFFGELVEYGKRKNITVKPLINSLGHNSLIPRVFPETCAKNEDGSPIENSYAFCTENEKTYEVMFNIYEEVIERYIKPFGNDSIQIGLDEVRHVCKCQKCRNIDHTELMVRYIIRLCKYLKSRGIKNVYFYHDMLFDKKNIINEDLKQRFIDEDVYDVAVIDWWNYRLNEFEFAGKKNEVNSIFRSIIKPMTGYFHWTLPPQIDENIRRFAILADKMDFEGIEPYGAYEECFDKSFSYSSDLSWNPSTADNIDNFNKRYAKKIFPDNSSEALKVLSDMQSIMFMIGDFEGNFIGNLDYYRKYSYTANLVPYPDDAFKTILENPKKNMQYLGDVYTKATSAIDFFDKCPSRLGEVWKLIAMQYSTYSDIFYTLCSLYLKSQSGEDIEVSLNAEVKRLLDRQNKLMYSAENIRIKATSYALLRNMSIMRQFLIDLYNSVLERGSDFELDITNFQGILSKVFSFLR